MPVLEADRHLLRAERGNGRADRGLCVRCQQHRGHGKAPYHRAGRALTRDKDNMIKDLQYRVLQVFFLSFLDYQLSLLPQDIIVLT